METGMIVIAAILIVVCTVPIMLIIGSTKKREKQFKKALNAAVTLENGTLTDYSINNNFSLGIDSKTNQIYFYKKTQEAEFLQKINLNNIKTCEVTKDTKRIKDGKSSYDIIIKIAMVFTYTNDNVKEQFLLFDYDESAQPSGELALADTWKKKVIDLINRNSTNSEKHKIQDEVLKYA